MRHLSEHCCWLKWTLEESIHWASIPLRILHAVPQESMWHLRERQSSITAASLKRPLSNGVSPQMDLHKDICTSVFYVKLWLGILKIHRDSFHQSDILLMIGSLSVWMPLNPPTDENRVHPWWDRDCSDCWAASKPFIIVLIMEARFYVANQRNDK
jgi:hypothetical protein